MRKLLLSAVAAAAVMAAASAHAIPTLIFSLTDTGTAGSNVTCQVTAATLANAPVPGCSGFTAGALNAAGNLAVTFGGIVGGYALNFSSTTSNTPGTAIAATITNSYNSVTNRTSGGSLIVSMVAIDFSLPTGPALTLFGSQSTSSNSNNAGSTINATFYASSANSSNPSTSASATTSCLLASTTSNDCTAATQNFTNTGLFSLQDIMTFNLVSGNSPVQGGSNLIVRNRVPEPMTTALVGLGLFGVALFSRRRKATQA